MIFILKLIFVLGAVLCAMGWIALTTIAAMHQEETGWLLFSVWACLAFWPLLAGAGLGVWFDRMVRA